MLSSGGANLVLGLALSMGLTLQSSALWAQAGRLEFTTPVINPLTGVFSFEVHWINTDDFWHVWQAEDAAVVKVFWMSMHSSGQDLAKGEHLFRIHARSKQTIEQPNDLFWQSTSSSGNLYFHNGSIGASLQLSPSKASNAFRVKVIGPNPTRDKTDLLFMMPESAEVELLIYDARGILLAQNRYALPEGYHSLSLDDLPDIKGIYTILTRTPFGSQTVRIIRF